MRTTPKHYAQLLYELTAGKKKKDQEAAVRSVAELLIKKNDLRMAGRIEKEFEKIYNAHNNIMGVKVKSAAPLTGPEKKKIIEGLERKLNKTIELSEIVDPKIKGGVIIRYEDTLINGSVLNKLKNLRANLIK